MPSTLEDIVDALKAIDARLTALEAQRGIAPQPAEKGRFWWWRSMFARGWTFPDSKNSAAERSSKR